MADPLSKKHHPRLTASRFNDRQINVLITELEFDVPHRFAARHAPVLLEEHRRRSCAVVVRHRPGEPIQEGVVVLRTHNLHYVQASESGINCLCGHADTNTFNSCARSLGQDWQQRNGQPFELI